MSWGWDSIFLADVLPERVELLPEEDGIEEDRAGEGPHLRVRLRLRVSLATINLPRQSSR